MLEEAEEVEVAVDQEDLAEAEAEAVLVDVDIVWEGYLWDVIAIVILMDQEVQEAHQVQVVVVAHLEVLVALVDREVLEHMH